MQLDPAQAAAAAQFDRQSAHYGGSHILAQTGDLTSALLHLSSLPVRPRVLDVATGGGHTAVFFAARGAEVTVGDIAPGMLARTAALAAERGLKVTPREFPAEAMPFGAGQFDLVTCRVAAHHFSNPDGFVREAARVLRPGGYLLLIDGSLPDGHPEAEEWLHRVEKWRDPSHGRFGSVGTWVRRCRTAALAVEHHELQPMKQPDLQWYFDTAGTTDENRAAVWEAVNNAPPAARALFRLGEEEGRTVWWWHRLVLVARKP